MVDMNRRKTKTERELIADINKRADLFCASYFSPILKGCDDCPLRKYEYSDCRISYIVYLLEREVERDENK